MKKWRNIMKATLLLANGKIFEGKAFGAEGTSFGEICFNTSMSGYQEILTDPSYAQQIITMTYPEIGNYGINSTDFESEKVHAKGLIVKNYCEVESHYKSELTLCDYLKKNSIIGISGIDTRHLTSIIRENGAMNALLTTEEISTEMKNKLKSWEMDKDIAIKASKNKKYKIEGKGIKLVVIDFGIKNSILKNLENLNCNLIIMPAISTYEEIISENPDAVLLSNGPGDPKDATKAIETAKKLIGKLPIFGICLGYQILSIALGANTYKLKYGHRGGNHPVINLDTQKVILTSQNHGYALDEATLPKNTILTYKNLDDNTSEGFKCEELKVEGVQFHPEAAPGPNDASEILSNWINKVEENKLCQKI